MLQWSVGKSLILLNTIQEQARVGVACVEKGFEEEV